MNKVILIGRLTKDPELQQTASGKNYCRFTLAVDRSYKQANQPDADFFNITAWEKKAEIITNYLSKGRQLAIAGRLQNDSYTAKDGTHRTVTEIILEDFDLIGRKSDSNTVSSNDGSLFSEDEEIDCPF